MKRWLLVLIGVCGLTAIGAAPQPVDTYPAAPIHVISAAGVVTARGLGAANDTARGTALAAAVTAAAAGDIVLVHQACDCATVPAKTGVRIVPTRDGLIYSTATTPVDGSANPIDINDFDAAGTIKYRGRQAELYAPEQEFCIWRDLFTTTNNYQDGIFSAGGGSSITKGDGLLAYSAPAGATSGTYLAPTRPRHAQYCVTVDIEAHNAAASGATYNDVAIGFAETTTATSDTLADKYLAIYRRTEGANQVFLHYTTAGTPTETSPVTISETPPFRLVYLQNHNSQAAAIEKDGKWRIVANQEIPTATLNFETITSVALLRPLVYFQSNGGQTTEITDASCRCLGSLGEREHNVVCYEDGTPVTDPTGRLVYVSCDDTHVTTQNIGNPVSNSEFMRNRHGVHLFDPATGLFVATTAKFSMKVSGRVFGCQEGSFIQDRTTGLYHAWFAEWNVSSPAQIKIYHRASRECPWTAGDKVYEDGELADTGLNDSVFGGYACYQFSVRRINGAWYAAGIRTNASPGRVVFLITDDNPDFSSPTLVWQGADLAEGGYLWRVGANWYVAAGVGTSQKIYNFADGTTARTFTTPPGSGGYDQFMDLLPWVRNGKTEYMTISFSDGNGRGGGQHGEDYQTGAGTYQNLAFGPRIVNVLGTFSGEQFTRIPNPHAVAP